MSAPLDTRDDLAVDALSRASAVQWQTSHPETSAWVVANAGSGKTHVLTQRVMRLLLDGSDPASILCLTFTKAAAAEMSRRIFGTLGRWATLADDALDAELRALHGEAPSEGERGRARRLFARALETPGGLRIQTIHAFCESLLQQFPFEANVPGSFSVLDEVQAAAFLAEAREDVLLEAQRGGGRVAEAVRRLAAEVSDMALDDALRAVIANREKLRAWIVRAAQAREDASGTVDDALADLRSRLDLRDDETEETLCIEICESVPWAGGECRRIADELGHALAEAGNRIDVGAHAGLGAILGATDAGAEAVARIEFFLKKDRTGWQGRKGTSRFGKAFREQRSKLARDFEAESERLLPIVERYNAAKAYGATEALLLVGDAILDRYAQAKLRAAALDFNDLIVRARDLLARSDAAAWVLYKLDARIDHILVDEAQDTSPDQWDIVSRLAEDFFSGRTAVERERTIFAVGDDKQSIFSFQGAAPDMLADMERYFRRKAEEAERSFVQKPLSLSFRSTPEVLDGVDRVFRELGERVTAFGYEAHSARRLDDPGRIVILPRAVRPAKEEPDDWTDPPEAPAAAETKLAAAIAAVIKGLIGRPLPSGKIAYPGGIMVLARKRDTFVTALNRALRAAQIPAAGPDRVAVATHIASLDLLALADVMLLPEDDLQLAALLKSPLIGLDEEALMHLAMERKGSLWSALRRSDAEAAGAAYEKLAAWRGMADRVSPFRFFATILGPDGGRRAFRGRIGSEADDVLDAFLAAVLGYEASGPPSLQGFVAHLRASEADIKREPEEGARGVRVMTVHGAKGLEADVVFLVDTGGLIAANQHRDVLVELRDARRGSAFLWHRRREDAPPAQLVADGHRDAEMRSEYLRLLYVAMTRARDVLYVCGIRGERTEKDTWYSLVRAALVPEAELDPETGELAAPARFPQRERPAIEPGPAPPAELELHPPRPAWLDRAAPPPPVAPRPLRPSGALVEPDRGPAREPPALVGAETARRRGILIHRLLQSLPGVAEERREAVSLAYLERENCVRADAALIWEETARVLADPSLAVLFGPDGRAEIDLAGRIATPSGDYVVSGRIDRLVRDAAGWRILDLKTDRAVPAGASAVDPAYVLQLAIYRHLIREIEPGASVGAGLLYTAGPVLVDIPEKAMDEALARLRAG